MQRMMKLAILGSTGSIGTQSLEVVRDNLDLMQVELLTANTQWELLAAQAREFRPGAIVIADERYYGALCSALSDIDDIKIYAGAEAIEQAVGSGEIDTVITAMVGFSGLAPTVAAIKAGKRIALANKETLVVAGDLIMPLSRQYGAPILPVDSEHSAILQCVVGEPSPIRRVVITASGGALRDFSFEQMQCATAEQALRHPCWSMGSKITVDSATMVNKGFEVIEAAHLFGLKADQVDVVIHPQSIVHSFVEFEDGAFKAQMGLPDMKLPIQYALTFPQRRAMPSAGSYNPWEAGSLDFFRPDMQKWPALALAYDVMRAGGTAPCVMNAANEVAVAAFLRGEILYPAIHRTIEKTLDAMGHEPITDLEHIFTINGQAAALAAQLIKR